MPNFDPSDASLEKTSLQQLYDISYRNKLSARKRRRLLDAFDVVLGFDLLAIILYISELKISGFLNIVSDTNEIFGITFSEGSITQIDNSDKETYIGALLIKEGFLTESELQALLKKQNLRLGEMLARQGKITAQQINDILYKQIVLKLRKLINSQKIQVSFSEAEIQQSDIKINEPKLQCLCMEWIFSSLDSAWLEVAHADVLNVPLIFQNDQFIQLDSLVKEQIQRMNLVQFIEIVKTPTALKKIKEKFGADHANRLLHIFSLLRLVVWDDIEKNNQPQDLRQLLSIIQKKTDPEKLELLSGLTKVPPHQSDRLYEALSAFVEKNQGTFETKSEILKLGMDMMLSPQKYVAAKKDQPQVDISLTLKETRSLLLSRNYFKAFGHLKTLKPEQLRASKVEIYFLWCLLAQAIDSNNKINMQNVQFRLNKIRPEDKFESEYFFVMGLYYHYINKDKMAADHFDKALKMDSNLKRARPHKKSFLSKLFRFAAAIIFLNIYASKSESAILSLNTVLKYANQYYEYQVHSQGVDIAQMKIDFSHPQELVQNEQLKTQADGCYGKKTTFSSVRFCPSLIPQENNTVEVYVDSVRVENKGMVILQDHGQDIVLEMKTADKVFFQLRTRKRRVVPYKIEKEAYAKFMSVDFVDLDKRRYQWKKTIGIADETFVIDKVDEILDLKQDFIISDPEAEKNQYSYGLKLPKEVIIVSNRIGLNFLAGFSSFTTQTPSFISTINSKVGYGLRLSYERNLSALDSLYGSFVYYRSSILADRNQNLIEQTDLNLIDLSAGYKQYFKPDWVLSYEMSYRNNFYSIVDSVITNYYKTVQTYSLLLSITPEYTLLEKRTWNWVADTGFGLILPQTTQYGKTSIGFSIEPSTRLSYKVDEWRWFLGLAYSHKTFKASDTVLTNRDFIYSLGFNYLF